MAHRSGRTKEGQAKGRFEERKPLSVIDIGSNSVRLVSYEGLTRSPSILFNEKVLCGLGKGVAETGKLEEGAKTRAIRAIRRFAAISERIEADKMHILATAAVREAENGQGFLKEIKEICGKPVKVLSGKQEANYASLGILSGFHEPQGIVGDLGGGSLELAGIGNSKTNGATTPLGGLRLEQLSGGDLAAAREFAASTLCEVNVDWPHKTKDFYAIGGTWRSLARLHMAKVNYPIEVVHGYEVAAEEYIEFCDWVVEKGIDKLAKAGAVSKNRRGLIPFGAVVMSETLKSLKAERVIMSAAGMREGFLYSLLSGKKKTADSLLEATRELSLLRARSPKHCLELATWTEQAFAELGIAETYDESRHRVASCYLADIAWRSKSDHRAQQTLGIILNSGFGGIDHSGRAYLAIAIFHRYEGMGSKTRLPAIASLANKRQVKRARILAALFRVLYLFSASMQGVLPELKFKKSGKDRYVLEIPEKISNLCGERPEVGIEQLSKELEKIVELKIVA